MSIVPLDAIQYLVQSEDVYTINKINDPAVNYVAQIWNNQIRANRGGFLIWDTITATAVTNPENFYWTVDGVDVITEPDTLQGQTIALQNGAVHTRYATGADYEAIMAQLFETFRGETMPWGVSDHLLSDSSSDAAPTPEPNLVITDLGGVWEGFTGDFQILFTLESKCKLNEVCGTFEIAEFSLSGEITIVDVIDNLYEFKVTNMSTGGPSRAVYESLELQDDGTLKYISQGASGGSQAILEKK